MNFFKFLKNVYLFLREQGAEKRGDRESQASSAVSARSLVFPEKLTAQNK